MLFDVDGTLVDSGQSIRRAWTTWMTEFEQVPDTSRNWNGYTSEALIRLMLPDEQVAAGLERIEELEVNDTHDIVALPGAVDALASVATIPAAVATSGTSGVAAARLRAAGLTAPTVVVTADDITHCKPHPEIFLTAAARLGVDPADCLVVEDAPAGVEAGRAAGCAVLGLLSTLPAGDSLDADAVVPNLASVRFVVDAGRVRVEAV